jgi:quercetin dioxygenase-like cupin family protein
MTPILYQTIDWQEVPATRHAGDSGYALWRTMQHDGLRVRMVEYSPGYFANHWCKKGHVVFCLEGELISELSDGRTFVLKAGMSYHVSDNVSEHRSHTTSGARLLIIDGDFLHHQKPLNPWRM